MDSGIAAPVREPNRAAGDCSGVGPEPLKRSEILIVLGLFLAAFVVYSLAWPGAPVMTLDGPSYMRLAQDIRNFSLRELPLRTPGLPLLLILTGSAEHVNRWFFDLSLLLHFTGIALLAYLLRVFRVPGKLVLPVIVLGLLPPFVEPAAYVASEAASQCTLLMVFVSVVLWLMKPRRTLFAVVSVGLPLTAMVRPTYELLVVLLIGCLGAGYAFGLFPQVSRGRMALLMAVSAVLTFGTQVAWSTVNYARFGYFGTTRMLPIALSIKTEDVLEFLPPEYADLRRILIPYRDQNLTEPFRDHTGKDYIYRAMPAVLKHYGGDLTAATIHLKAAFLYLAKHKPMSFLSNGLKTLGLVWMPNDCELCGSNFAVRGLTALLQIGVEAVFLLQALALVGAGLIYAPARPITRGQGRTFGGRIERTRVWAYGFGVAIVIYTLGLSCLMGTGEPRYRQTVDLLMIGLCALGYAIWRDILARECNTAGDGIQE